MWDRIVSFTFQKQQFLEEGVRPRTCRTESGWEWDRARLKSGRYGVELGYLAAKVEFHRWSLAIAYFSDPSTGYP